MKQHKKNHEKKQPAVENKKADENAILDSANERVQDDNCAWKKPAMFWLYQNRRPPHATAFGGDFFHANAFKK
ncbi:hypothetical protein A9P82_08870 [Arachidicoccus ginsenosidimutans]|nr:hypothetical protein A9P82_08870 [Arachidicoccus sp. BS20]